LENFGLYTPQNDSDPSPRVRCRWVERRFSFKEHTRVFIPLKSTQNHFLRLFLAALPGMTSAATPPVMATSASEGMRVRIESDISKARELFECGQALVAQGLMYGVVRQLGFEDGEDWRMTCSMACTAVIMKCTDALEALAYTHDNVELRVRSRAIFIMSAEMLRESRLYVGVQLRLEAKRPVALRTSEVHCLLLIKVAYVVRELLRRRQISRDVALQHIEKVVKWSKLASVCECSRLLGELYCICSEVCLVGDVVAPVMQLEKASEYDRIAMDNIMKSHNPFQSQAAANSYYRRGVLLQMISDPASSVLHLQMAVSIQTRFCAQAVCNLVGDQSAHFVLGRYLHTLARFLRLGGRLREAASIGYRLLCVIKEAGAQFPAADVGFVLPTQESWYAILTEAARLAPTCANPVCLVRPPLARRTTCVCGDMAYCGPLCMQTHVVSVDYYHESAACPAASSGRVTVCHFCTKFIFAARTACKCGQAHYCRHSNCKKDHWTWHEDAHELALEAMRVT
jgi:hypothetical protein